MAQERFWNWLDDDSTFRLNFRDLIIIPYGRYAGFDKSNTAGMNLVLVHTVTNKTKVKKDLTESNPMGIWKTKQGVIVSEDDAITIPIVTGDDTYPRIDVIVGEHEYIEAEGGMFAQYKVIQGVPSATPIAPDLTYPTKQVILGTLLVPAGTTSLDASGVIYTPADTPNFNEDNTIMHTNKIQTSTALKIFNVQRGELVMTSLFGGVVDTSIQSNFYAIVDFDASQRYLDFNAFSAHLTGAGQSVTFFTTRALKIVSGGSLLVPDGTVYVEANTTFTFLEITGALSGSKRYVLTKGGELTRNRFLNKVSGLFGWNKGKDPLPVYNENVEFKFINGNYMALDYEGVVRSMSSVARLSQTPNVNISEEGGTIIILQSKKTCTIRHNDPTTVSNSKPIWLPAEQSEWLCKAGTHLMLIEDFTHWRLMSVWNSELTTLEVPVPPKLINLLDTVITGGTPANPTPANHVLYSDGTNFWRNRDFKDWIETTNIKMKKTIEWGAMRFDSPTDVPMVDYSGEQGLNLVPNGNVVFLNSAPVPTTLGNYGTPVLREVYTDIYGLIPFSWNLSATLVIENGLNTDINTCRLYYRKLDSAGNVMVDWYSDGSSVYNGDTIGIDIMFAPYTQMEFRLGVFVNGSTTEIFSNIMPITQIATPEVFVAPPSVVSVITSTGGSTGFNPEFRLLPSAFQEGTELIVVFGSAYTVNFNSTTNTGGWLGIKGMGSDAVKIFNTGEIVRFVRYQNFWKAIYATPQVPYSLNRNDSTGNSVLELKQGTSVISSLNLYDGIKVTHGSVIGNAWTGGGYYQFNFTRNYAYVYPPAGYSIYNLKGVIPSIGEVNYNGDVDDNDTIWCNYQVDYTNSRIIIIANNSEARARPIINYLAIWIK